MSWLGKREIGLFEKTVQNGIVNEGNDGQDNKPKPKSKLKLKMSLWAVKEMHNHKTKYKKSVKHELKLHNTAPPSHRSNRSYHIFISFHPIQYDTIRSVPFRSDPSVEIPKGGAFNLWGAEGIEGPCSK